MAVAIWVEFGSGMSQEVYDHANRAVLEPGWPEGLVFHSAGPSPEGGWRIIDVWDAREHFDRNFADRVAPALTELFGEEGMARATPPTITEWPLHDFYQLGNG